MDINYMSTSTEVIDIIFLKYKAYDSYFYRMSLLRKYTNMYYEPTWRLRLVLKINYSMKNIQKKDI